MDPTDATTLGASLQRTPEMRCAKLLSGVAGGRGNGMPRVHSGFDSCLTRP